MCIRDRFTPDLLHSDITGINYFNIKKSEFEFVPGPVFSNILLADEINRATPTNRMCNSLQIITLSMSKIIHRINTPFISGTVMFIEKNITHNNYMKGTFPIDKFRELRTPFYYYDTKVRCV